MNILNIFSKSKNAHKNIDIAASILQMKDLYETKDYESFFENYSKELENKYTLIDLDSFLTSFSSGKSPGSGFKSFA